MNNNIEPLYRNGNHYDLQHENLINDIKFYTGQAKKFGGPILELACGTGRITIPIAAAGLEIVGVDNSTNMLSKAIDKSNQENLNIEFYEKDIRNFELNKKFNLVIFPFNSIAHLYALADLENCFKCVKNHMADGAKFIIDFFNPDLKLLTRDENEYFPLSEYIDPETNQKVTIKETSKYDKTSQVKYCTWHYETGEKKFSHPLNMRIFFPQELEILLKYNGFEIEEKFGNFDESKFESSSPKQIIVCSKK